jgi:hypothetical protein
LYRSEAVLVRDDDFSGFHIPDVFRFNDVQGAGLRSEDDRVALSPNAERPESVRVPNPKDRVGCEHYERPGSSQIIEYFHQTLFERAPLVEHEMGNKLGIRGGLEDGSLSLQFPPELRYVHNIPIVTQREDSIYLFDEEWLCVAQERTTGSGVPYMTDAHVPFELIEPIAFKNVRYQAHALLGGYGGTIAHHNSGRLLTPMLECIESKIDQRGRVLCAVDSKYSAFLPFGRKVKHVVLSWGYKIR